MKFREIFRFEFVYQVRRVSTWIYFLVLLVIAFLMMESFADDALERNFIMNAPILIAVVTVFGSLFWLLVAGAVSGGAAARDVQTRMHPLLYTAPAGKAAYLGGRFLAALTLQALILLSLPAGILVSLYAPGLEAEHVGPFRPAAYLAAYFFIALPNAFAATAIQFSMAALRRRVTASYLGGVLLFITAYVIAFAVGREEMGKTLDLIGIASIVNAWDQLTPKEMDTRLIVLEGPLLWSRILWIAVAIGILLYTCRRFRFTHTIENSRRNSGKQLKDVDSPTTSNTALSKRIPVAVPHVHRTFGFATRVQQALAITRSSFVTIIMSRGGLILLTAIALLTFLTVPGKMENGGVALSPGTASTLYFLAAPLGSLASPWIFITLLIVFWAGELTWREREAGLSDIADTAPVPDWVLFGGKYLGLLLVLVSWTVLLTMAGVFIQIRMGNDNIDIQQFGQVLLGFQLVDYGLFALLVMVVHVLVNQKYVGNLVALLVYGYIAFAPMLGISHRLLIFASDPPGWNYSDLRDPGSSLGPLFLFKGYWLAWALLLAVAARLFWVRGREQGLRLRLLVARIRFTRQIALVVAGAVGFILILGSFIFWTM